jgi:hypothetical protein
LIDDARSPRSTASSTRRERVRTTGWNHVRQLAAIEPRAPRSSSDATGPGYGDDDAAAAELDARSGGHAEPGLAAPNAAAFDRHAPGHARHVAMKAALTNRSHARAGEQRSHEVDREQPPHQLPGMLEALHLHESGGVTRPSIGPSSFSASSTSLGGRRFSEIDDFGADLSAQLGSEPLTAPPADRPASRARSARVRSSRDCAADRAGGARDEHVRRGR